MTDVTVRSLAKEILIPIDRLIQQFADAGINKTAVDFVTQQEKENLLAYLKRDRGAGPNRLTLQRKTHSTLHISSTTGKSKSVKIEVRKKLIYMQHDPQDQKQERAQKKEISQKNLQHAINKKTHFHTRNNTTFEDSWHETIESKKCTNQKTSGVATPLQAAEKARREAETAELRRKAEEQIERNVKEKALAVAEEVRRMVAECGDTWNTAPEIIEEDSRDYHITTSQHARAAEDESDRRMESERRVRSGKNNKQKKNNRLSESKADREEARAVGRGGKSRRKSSTLTQGFKKPVQIISRDVIISETITVAELANKMAVKGSQVIKTMMRLGTMATINQVLDQETAQLVAEETGHKVILRRENDLEELVMSDRNTGDLTSAESRAPVVTIMGHVDHGKTSLLDCIRSTKVAAGEAGGITQKIGAYRVEAHNEMITFLDTPGHSAFTAMRARGVQATDIVVLVVAADDGVMPQTIEAIQHAKAAKVPVVVVINKIDKPEADSDRVKKELTQHSIVPEEWGGESQFVEVSAKSGQGINQLLEAILLQAEVLELKATRTSMASGVVIESFLDKGRGPVATVLVREGTLNRGDIVLCGLEYGRVRAMSNEVGRDVVSAGPSIPVEILGLSGVPVAGDEVRVVRDEKKAREVALYRQGKFREVKLAQQQKAKLENIFSNLAENTISELNIILKADAQGSAEAIRDALEKLSTDEVKVKIVASGVGGITETDVTLAVASSAVLLGFNVRADASARRVAEKENLDLRYYSVIYNLISEVKHAMSGMLAPEYKQEIIGLAEVRDVFRTPKYGTIAGCMVTEGIVKQHNKIRVLRENVVIYEGQLESLRRFKDNVNEIRNGMECGIGIKNYNNVQSGDVIEVFETIEIQRTIK